MAMPVVETPLKKELQELLSTNFSFFIKQIDSYTPCLIENGILERRKINRRLSFLLEKILTTAQKYFSKRQQEKLIEAIHYAAEKHAGVYRKDGKTPYLQHTLEVACILIDKKVFDYKVIISAIIHDVVEDTNTKVKEIREKFGYAIARIVELLTKHPNFIRRIGYWWLMKNEINLSIRWRVLIIKFADRIHNLMTLACMPEENRVSKVKETIEEFPSLYNALMRTLHKLRQKGIIQKDNYLQLPFHLNTMLVYELSQYQ